uniref:Uncharacterized protein n=1 Tax=Panagrellus redivivus TaxID=6233 RepID=A0A7E4V9Y0_PANRE
MLPITKFLVFSAVICFGHAEVELQQGKNQTVGFKGDELSILIENRGQKGIVQLCFQSTPDSVNTFCPAGYAEVLIHMTPNQNDETFRLDRRGQIYSSQHKPTIGGSVVFQSDGTIDVLVAGMPSGVSVRLLNAVIPVTTTTVSAFEKKESSDNTAMIGIICGVAALILVLIVIGCVLAYF